MTVFAHHGDQQRHSRPRPTLAEIRQWPATVSLTEAAAAFGFSAAWAYELCAHGEFPARVLTVRGRKQVITASLVQVLSQTEAAGPA